VLQSVSATTGIVIRAHGPTGSTETANFLEMTDKFFDCVNGISDFDVKPERRGYRSVDDPRFEVSFYYCLLTV
jgi:hypothetical protein